MKMLRLSDLKEGICPKNRLHDFAIIYETDKLVVEKCKFCGKKIKFHKKDGQVVDKYKYGKYHVRDHLQFNGNTKYLFKKIFGSGEERIKEMENAKERVEMNEEQIKGYEELMQRWI